METGGGHGASRAIPGQALRRQRQFQIMRCIQDIPRSGVRDRRKKAAEEPTQERLSKEDRGQSSMVSIPVRRGGCVTITRAEMTIKVPWECTGSVARQQPCFRENPASEEDRSQHCKVMHT